MGKIIFLSLVICGFSNAQASVPAVETRVIKHFSMNSVLDSENKVVFSCDAVEHNIIHFLKTLGADRINVDCNGGISPNAPPSSWQDVDVELSFTALQESSSNAQMPQANFKTVTIDRSDSCFMMSQIFAAVKDSFTLKDLQVTSQCMRVDSPFHLQVSTLF